MSETIGSILVVDDEVELAQALKETLADHNFETVAVTSAAEGVRQLERRRFDLLLTDLMMAEMDGIQLLRKALEIDPSLTGIVMTGQGSIATAVESMRVGAFDYILKPFNLKTMMPILHRAMEMRRLRLQNQRLRQYVQRLSYESPRYEIIGHGPAMQKVVQWIGKAAPTDATVLVRGPSGSGKELVCRALHFNSHRRDQPLVTVNCATLQESLLESELFGHEKGAFTSADRAKEGLIEVAEGGTLFIDEVAEMSPSLQAKLLRVLEDGHFRRVGGAKELRADVRILAATNKSLEEEQLAGRFRSDLFYRLNVLTIELPALKERREDIPDLVHHLLTTRPVGPVPFQVHPDAMKMLLSYSWPGNVRELANVLERARILAEDNLISPDDLPESMRSVCASLPGDVGPLNLVALERRAVETALHEANGNKVHAARLLGVSRRSLYRLIDRHHLDPHDRAG